MNQAITGILLTSVALCSAQAHAQSSLLSEQPANQNPGGSVAAASSSDGQGSSAQKSTGPGLDEIIVTANRRRQNLQQVPAVIQAFSAKTLDALNIKGVEQLSAVVPGLVVTPSGGNNIFLRGVGSNSLGFAEAQVAIYVDGVYLANPAIGIYSFNNIDQIEVLKGPQGTLYGRNATAGLISIKTRDPGKDPRLDASIGLGNYQTVQGSLYGSLPISDTLGANLAVFHRDQRKGFGVNVFTGNDNLKGEETGVQAKLQWRPSSKVKATLGFLYNYNNRDYGFALGVTEGTVGTDGTLPLGRYRNASRIDPYAPLHAYIGSFKLEGDLGFATLLSTSAYQVVDQEALFQAASGIIGRALPGQSATYVPVQEDGRTFSQELQLTSNRTSNSRFDWVLGAFYFNDRQRLRQGAYGTCEGAVCSGPTPSFNDSRPSTRSYSAYGDGTLHISDSTRVTLGLRYTDETRKLSGMAFPLPGRPNSVSALLGLPSAPIAPAGTTVFYPGQGFFLNVNGVPTLQPGIPTKLNFGKLTYRAVVAQDVGKNIHLYASHNLGFKSGAFNPNSYTNPPVEPELLYATEIGAKSELFNRALRLNVAYFHYTYKNLQLRSLAPPAIPGNPILLNIASERVDGIDADFILAAAPGLTITGSTEYLDAKFRDYPGASCLTPGTRVVNGVTVGVVTSVTCNLAGRRVVNAPPFSGSLGFAYAFDTRIGKFELNSNARYVGRHSQIPDGSYYQDAYALINASINWTAPSERFDMRLWVSNITDSYYYRGTQSSTNYASLPGEPRTFGLTLGFHVF